MIVSRSWGDLFARFGEAPVSIVHGNRDRARDLVRAAHGVDWTGAEAAASHAVRLIVPREGSML
jgi:hypothetical protein